jgi:hypothetical protein
MGNKIIDGGAATLKGLAEAWKFSKLSHVLEF